MDKRAVITIDECMKMSAEDLNRFIDADNQYLAEHPDESTSSNIDFCGMTITEIAEKYGCIPIDDAFENIRNKLLR